MKSICVVLHSLKRGGGIQERRIMLANQWARRGYEVTIVSPSIPEGVQDRLHESIHLDSLGLGETRERWRVFNMPLKLTRYFGSSKEFDAVIASSTVFILVTACALFFSRKKYPLYGTLHNPLGMRTGLLGILERLFVTLALNVCALRVTAFAGVSKGVSHSVKKRLFSGKPVEVIYNPVIDVDKRRIEEAEPIQRSNIVSSEEKLILAIGRLHPQKGFDLLLRAFSGVQHPAVLVILGEGPERARLGTIAAELGISEKVRFLGYQKNVYSFLIAADCFVLSSRWEGFGNVLVEALYCNAPVVAFDCASGPGEILADGRYGRLVPCFDCEQMSQAIDSALEAGRFSNQRWSEYTVENIGLKYLDFMQLSGPQLLADTQPVKH